MKDETNMTVHTRQPVAGCEHGIIWVNLGPYGSRTDYITRIGTLRQFVIFATPTSSAIRFQALSELEQLEAKHRDEIERLIRIECAGDADRSFFRVTRNAILLFAIFLVVCVGFSGVFVCMFGR